MALLHAVVARGNISLAETCPRPTCVDSAKLEALLSNVGTSNHTDVIHVNETKFHYVVTNGLVFVVCADSACPDAASAAFLKDLVGQITTQADLSQAQNAVRNQLNSRWQSGMNKLLAEHNARIGGYGAGPSGTRVDELRVQIDGVTRTMQSNVEKVLTRGQNLEELEQKSTSLEEGAHQFRVSANRVRRRMWCLNAKWTMILVAVVVLVVLILILVILGETGAFKKHDGSGGHHSSTVSPS